MTIPVQVPPFSVPFALVYGEFLRAFPLDLDRYKSIPADDELVRAAIGLWLDEGEAVSAERAQRYIGELRQDAVWAQPSHMLRSFRERLEAQDHGRIILVTYGKQPVELSPDLLRFADPKAAVLGVFAVHRSAMKTSPLAEHSGKEMYLPDEVAAAVRRTFPASSEAAFPDPVPEQMRPRGLEEDSPEPARERDIVAEIVRQFDLGSVLVREDARQRYAPGMKRAAWASLWKEAANQRPDLSKRGPKRRRQPPA